MSGGVGARHFGNNCSHQEMLLSRNASPLANGAEELFEADTVFDEVADRDHNPNYGCSNSDGTGDPEVGFEGVEFAGDEGPGLAGGEVVGGRSHPGGGDSDGAFEELLALQEMEPGVGEVGDSGEVEA